MVIIICLFFPSQVQLLLLLMYLKNGHIEARKSITANKNLMQLATFNTRYKLPFQSQLLTLNETRARLENIQSP